jgi:lactoylglutathione lyase
MNGDDAMSERPFRVLGVQQIAVGGADKGALRAFWVDLLGFTPEGTYRSERENVDEDITSVGAGAARVEVDLMQPIDPARSPRVHEPALNHVGLWIDDLAAAVAWLTARGVRFTPGGIRCGASGFEVCFVHPKGSAESPRGAEGVLVELVQAPPAVIAAFAALSTSA